MRKIAMLMIALGVMVGSAAAGTLENLKTYVAANSIKSACGGDTITNAAEIIAITAGDEAAVIQMTLRAGGCYQLLARALMYDKLSADGLAVLNNSTNKIGNSGGLITSMLRMSETGGLSVADRQQLYVPLLALLNRSVADANLKNDAMIYRVINDKYDGEKLLTWLVSSELKVQADVTLCKTELYNIAVVLAKASLRAEGKTFVVDSHGVNPLAVKLQPVITALNAPCVTGLEAALQDLGLTIAAIDRTQLAANGITWKTQIMSGSMAPDKINGLLPSLSVALGTEAFNTFVDEYNNAGR